MMRNNSALIQLVEVSASVLSSSLRPADRDFAQVQHQSQPHSLQLMCGQPPFLSVATLQPGQRFEMRDILASLSMCSSDGRGQGMPGCASPCSRQVTWPHAHVTEGEAGDFEVKS